MFRPSVISLCYPMDFSETGFPVFHHLPEFEQTQSIESVMPSNNLIFYHLLILLPSIFPSMRVFSNELALHIRWPKHWSFSFSISPSNEYSGFISFGIDWFDLLAVQGTLKSLLQCYNLKASILWAFFVIQFSHPYMTIGKTIALTIQTFMSKVMSLLLHMSLILNMLSRLVITFLPRSKCLLMEYYSAIKRNSFESVLMRWMNLLFRVKWVRKRKINIIF